MLSPDLRRRLSRIARRDPAPAEGLPPPPGDPAGPAGEPAAPPQEPQGAPRRPLQLSYDPRECGELLETARGSAWSVSVPLISQLEDLAERHRSAAGLAQEGALLVDIETAGLAAAPVFLVGFLELTAERFALTQILARDYTEEAALLERFAAVAPAAGRLVTFNGAAFDLPYLEDRGRYHGLPGAWPDGGPGDRHLDLLPPARRRWRRAATNCRLETLEKEVCGRARMGDVPGQAIPGLYHEFVRSGNWSLMTPVLHHNALDLLTLAEIWVELAQPAGPG